RMTPVAVCASTNDVIARYERIPRISCLRMFLHHLARLLLTVEITICLCRAHPPAGAKKKIMLQHSIVQARWPMCVSAVATRDYKSFMRAQQRSYALLDSRPGQTLVSAT